MRPWRRWDREASHDPRARRHALDAPFVLGAVLLLLGAELGGAWHLSRSFLAGELSRARSAALAQTEFAAALAAPSLGSGGHDGLAAVLAPLVALNPSLLAVRIEDARGEVLHSWMRGAAGPEGWWRAGGSGSRSSTELLEHRVAAPGGGMSGRVAILWDQQFLRARAAAQFRQMALLSGGTALLIVILAFCLLRRRLDRFRRDEERNRELAMRDMLTGLLNRRGFADAVENGTLAAAWAARRPLLLALADLDGFKPVNDTFGHAAGDELLQQLALRLQSEVSGRGVVARLGGDEFAVLVELDPDDPAASADAVAARLLRLTRAPIPVHPEGRQAGGAAVSVRVGLSLGCALAPTDAQDLTELMRQADAALYRAKAEGKDRSCRFLPEMDPRIGTRRAARRLEAELRQALASETLQVHYQPIRHLRTRRILALEALARWPCAAQGFIPPSEFIPIAEANGLIGPLTEQLLRQACRDALSWPRHVVLSFNLSPLQIRQGDVAREVARILEDTGLDPLRLQLELTESAVIGDVREGRERLDALKALGVQLAIDDFGTRHSNLRELQALPFDKIKVDAGFVRAMAVDPGARKIVTAIVGLGESLGLPVVAEGIESEADVSALLEMGCEQGQGWLLGRPLPAEQVLGLLRSSAPATPPVAEAA